MSIKNKIYFNPYAEYLFFKLSKKFKPLIIRKDTTDFKVFRDVFAKKELELKIKIEPKLIIDGGAYVGYSSLFYADKYPGAKIYAIEPNPTLFDILIEHTKRIKNIVPINAGLWYSKTKLNLIDNNKIGEWAYETVEEENGPINSITIDDVLEMSNEKQIDILKLDIEGAEKELFSRNYRTWIKKVKIIVIELHDWMEKNCSQSLYSAINKNEWIEQQKHEKLILINKKI